MPASLHLADHAWTLRDLDPVQARTLARRSAEGRAELEAQVVHAYLDWRAGDFEGATRCLAAALTTLRAEGPSVWQARAASVLSCLAGDLNEPDLALTLLDEQIQLCEALDITELRASGIHDLAVQLRHLNPARSRELLLQARDAFRRCRYPIGDLLVHGNLGELDREAGQYDSALRLHRAALSDPLIAHHPSIEAWTLHGAVRAAHQGRLPRPDAELDRLRALLDSPHLDVQVEVVPALSLHLPPHEAARLLRGVLDRPDLGSHYRAGLLHEQLSEALEDTGDDRGALRHLKLARQHERRAHAGQTRHAARLMDILRGMDDTRARNAALERHLNELRTLHAQAQRQSLTDPLTGLGNRRQFQQDLQTLTGADALLLIDLDHFKRVNDTLGHPTGDTVLTQLGRLLASASRGEDRAYRYGGEEFAVILRSLPAQALDGVAERVRAAVERSVFPDVPWTLTVSIGAARAADLPGDAILRGADEALYAAKRAGRNRVRRWAAAPPTMGSSDHLRPLDSAVL
ncbi:diguanylate cyclase [Deinococcus sp. JMULE3]|uniref:GGDEF domain-containing protein n=1 Tax=Deinococcus sp. JMULE3 TaxID=2518341 RepID=UPI0015771C53|nr:GGDEF domain-containing protein [Deinococcus sp. JMULE3]NTX99033.1 GGDEF domain-containing protein [Deinococcus sp. JMULE3]